MADEAAEPEWQVPRLEPVRAPAEAHPLVVVPLGLVLLESESVRDEQ